MPHPIGLHVLAQAARNELAALHREVVVALSRMWNERHVDILARATAEVRSTKAARDRVAYPAVG